jgi:hypothetical protein
LQPSVADPGCLSRIHGQKVTGSRIRIRNREFLAKAFLILIFVTKLLEI